MGFAQQIALDAKRVFANTGDLAESFTYTSVSFGALPVTGQVFRQLPAGVEEAQGSTAVSIELWIAASDLAKVDTGGDFVMLAWRPGGTASRFDVQEVINPDGGMWHIRVRGKAVA